jgi:DNA replication and repair protein RecF
LEKIRDFGRGRDELGFWTEKILKDGHKLQEKRTEFLNFAEKHLGRDYEVIYHKNEINEERLEKHKDSEVAAAQTLVGPHRDDFSIKLNGYDLAHYGSRGEKRTAILALKICETDFIEKLKGERPILLLDDIFSELDMEHRESVMKLVEKQQTIITTADENDVKNGFEVIRL